LTCSETEVSEHLHIRYAAMKKFLNKKIPALCFFLLWVIPLSFAQIYRGEGETKNGTAGFSLYYVEYTGYRCIFYINGVSVFLDEDNIAQLKAVLDKFITWEELANAEQISLTKTIDSISFTSFHFNRTFFKEPLSFYFVFTGGPVETAGSTAAKQGNAADNENSENSDSGGDAPAARYTLYIDTTLDRIEPFRLSSKTVREMQLALSPEKLSEAWDAYERQKALEEMFQ